MPDYREDLVDLLHNELKRYPYVARGMIFGHPGWKWMNRTFVFPYEDGICLKLPKADYEAALRLAEAVPFTPMGEKPMGTWVVITFPESETYLREWHWVEKALDYVKTDEGAPTKSRKRKEEKGN